MLKQDERLRKYVTIEGISEDSYLRSGELELNRRRNLMIKDGSIAEKYKPQSLLDLVVGNTSYVFNLDKQIERIKRQKDIQEQN